MQLNNKQGLEHSFVTIYGYYRHNLVSSLLVSTARESNERPLLLVCEEVRQKSGICFYTHCETARGELVSSLPQIDSWRVCARALNASRPPSATVSDASPLSKSPAAGCCSSAAAWRDRTISVCSAPQLRPSTTPFSAAPRTCATSTPPRVR